MSQTKRGAAAQVDGAPAEGEQPTEATTPAEPAEPVVEETKRPEVQPFMSEGMRHDLVATGRAVDPSSGVVFLLDAETGEVTIEHRGAVSNE